VSLQRKTELRSDPEKWKATQRRGAERYAERVRERGGRRPLERRTELAKVGKRTLAEHERDGTRPGRRTLRETTKGLVASREQREKIRGLVSIVSAQGPCHPAHLWPQGKGGCAHPDCVVPLTPFEHFLFDDGKLDVLPALIERGCWVELGHMVLVHQVDPQAMIHRLTGERYEPESQVRVRAALLAVELAKGSAA